jgi:mannose-6-phosphate isomerase-like protein (cupin superfamily)/DNA-binding transcriptional regulator YiaG
MASKSQAAKKGGSSARTGSQGGRRERAENSPTAARELAAPSIGQRLRELREQHRLTMRGLAELAGVSASLISDVERGRVEPSISALKRLAGALDTTLIYFFSEDGPSEDRVVRRADRRALGRPSFAGPGNPEPGIHFELASPDSTETIEAIYGRYDVGASMGDEPVTHEGEEWGMVLTGRLKVWVGDDIYFLEPGDAISFPSTTPHRMANAADEVTEYIWIDTPKSF